MKMHYLALSALLVGVLPHSASAQLRGLLEGAKNTLNNATDKVADVVDAAQGDGPQADAALAELQNAALAQLPVVDMHEYEAALSVSDQMCTEIIDPFQLSGNVAEIAEDLMKKDGVALLRNVVPGGTSTVTGENLLGTAKTRAKQLNWLPMDQELAYGQKIHDMVVANDKRVIVRTNKGRVKKLYEDADALLAKVMAKIDEQHPYTFQLLLIDSEDINATALPGGFVHLNTGVLASDHAELVLAHEIGHVFKRHQTREAQARLIDSIDTVDDLRQLLSKDADVLDQAMDRTAGLYGALQNYSRQQELQADACAVRMAGRIADIKLDQMIDSYVDSIAQTTAAAAQQDLNTDSAAVLPELPLKRQSGHPEYPERRQRMKEVSQQLGLAQNQAAQ
jgi:hypothetical protein